MQDSNSRLRRRYSAQLKAEILAECAVPGASVAAIAMKHGINPNVVHKWRRLRRREEVAVQSLARITGEFVPLSRAPVAAPVAQEIRIELRRGATAMNITWPTAAASDCAAWMRELLR